MDNTSVIQQLILRFGTNDTSFLSGLILQYGPLEVHPDLFGYLFKALNATQREIWFVSSSSFLLALIGFCLYVKVGIVILKHKAVEFSNPFYKLVVYLAVPDCLFLLVQMVGFIVTVVGFKNVNVYFTIILGFIEQISSWSLFSLISVLGLNRYICICHNDKYQSVFGGFKVHIWGCLCWVLGCILPSVDYSCSCYNFKNDYAWKFSCAYYGCMKTAIYFDQTVSILFTVFVPIINMMTFCHYQWKKNKLSRMVNCRSNRISKKDLKMLFQFVVISCVFIFYTVIYWIQDLLQLSQAGDIALTFASILNSSINPYLYVIFNADIRTKIFSTKVTPISSINISSKTLQVGCSSKRFLGSKSFMSFHTRKPQMTEFRSAHSKDNIWCQEIAV